jgi:hypothetical protein
MGSIPPHTPRVVHPPTIITPLAVHDPSQIPFIHSPARINGHPGSHEIQQLFLNVEQLKDVANEIYTELKLSPEFKDTKLCLFGNPAVAEYLGDEHWAPSPNQVMIPLSLGVVNDRLLTFMLRFQQVK